MGYRVRSPRGVQFRRWASTVLKEYLVKGFVMDDERLKNPDGRPDFLDEMLERIREIRASEKRFYLKVRDLFALSSDYDNTDNATQQFFATVQNLLLYAVTRISGLRELARALLPAACCGLEGGDTDPLPESLTTPASRLKKSASKLAHSRETPNHLQGWRLVSPFRSLQTS